MACLYSPYSCSRVADGGFCEPVRILLTVLSAWLKTRSVHGDEPSAGILVAAERRLAMGPSSKTYPRNRPWRDHPATCRFTYRARFIHRRWGRRDPKTDRVQGAECEGCVTPMSTSCMTLTMAATPSWRRVSGAAGAGAGAGAGAEGRGSEETPTEPGWGIQFTCRYYSRDCIWYLHSSLDSLLLPTDLQIHTMSGRLRHRGFT